jgi:hypothetical protein
MSIEINTRRPIQECPQSQKQQVACVIYGAKQVEITGIDPPIAFRCGGKVYTECERPYIKTLMDREWETGLIDGRAQ